MRTLGLLVAVLVLIFAVPVRAQFDHLHCVKVKDGAAKASYDMVAAGDFLLAKCALRVPAKLACYRTAKVQVAPPPPGGGPSNPPTPAIGYLCYKVKCSTGNNPVTDVRTDQFGTHSLTLRGNSVYCAPASPNGAFVDPTGDLW